MHSAVLLSQRVCPALLSVTHRYCVWTDKPILKHLRPSGSPIILVFFDPLRRYHISRVTSSVGALNTRGLGKLAIIDWNRRLSRKLCEIGRWLLWNVNRKSWVADWFVSLPTTLSDLKVTTFFEVEYLKKNGAFYGQSYYRTLIGNHT